MGFVQSCLSSLWVVGRSLLVLTIVTFLSSCTLPNEPPRAIVIEALQSQIQTTQISIAQSLDLQPLASSPDVSRVRVDHQEVLKVEGERFVT